MFEVVSENTEQQISSQEQPQPEASIVDIMGQPKSQPTDSGATQESDSSNGATTSTDSGATQAAAAEQPKPTEAKEYFDIPDDALIRVPFNGETLEVTGLQYKQGFQREQDYTRKAQDLANRQTQLDTNLNAITQRMAEYDQTLADSKKRLEALIPHEPDWVRLRAENPAQYDETRAAWDAIKKNLDDVEKEQQRVAQERQQTFGQQMQTHLQNETQQLVKAMPELKDQATAQKWFSEITEYAQHAFGMPPQMVASATDHRFFLMMEKAMKYDALQNKGKEQKPGSKIQTSKPGSSASGPTGDKLSQQRKRFQKSGSVEDAAALIAAQM